MDQEQLIRQIMAEVMANLGKDSVAFQKKSPAAGGAIGKEQYPLGEKMPEKVFSATGKKLSDFSLDKLKSGELTAEDFRIAPETLEMQAQVAESVDRDSLARNMRRAAELIAVPTTSCSASTTRCARTARPRPSSTESRTSWRRSTSARSTPPSSVRQQTCTRSAAGSRLSDAASLRPS